MPRLLSWTYDHETLLPYWEPMNQESGVETYTAMKRGWRDHLALLLAFTALFALTTPPRSAGQPGLTRSRVVGSGVRHLEFLLTGPFTLDVLEVTFPNPYVHLETFRLGGLKTTSAQAAANDRDGHRVIGAVNGDLFSAAGVPTGNQVANGKFAHGVQSSRSHLALDTRQRPMIEQMSFDGSVQTLQGASYALSGVNVARVAGALTFYTSYNGATTATTGGVESAVEFLDSTLTSGDTLRCRLISTIAGGNSPIPSSGGILSASTGSASDFLSAARVGDTLMLYLGFYPPMHRIVQAVGGAGRILQAGENVTKTMSPLEGLTANFTGVRNPRTFFGFNQDTTKLFLCTVDGRQTSSVGMTFDEMAAFLTSLGVTDAFNLDGGGSTTMIVRGETVNAPSDPGGERTVGNTLQLISTAPRGTLASLVIKPRRTESYMGQAIAFQATGTNEYCDSIPLPPDLSWEIDARLGTIAQGGLFTPGAVIDSGWVRASWHAVRDSAWVVVHSFAAISPRSAAYVMAPGDSLTMRILGTTGGSVTVSLQNSLTTFSPSSSIISVDNKGVVHATSLGTAMLDVQYGGLSCQASFDCTGNDTSINVEPLSRFADWSISRVNAVEQEINVSVSDNPSAAGEKVFLIDHSHLPGPKGVNLSTLLPLGGRPDSLTLRVYGSGNADTLRITLTDGDGVQFSITSGSVVDWSGEWRDAGFRADHAIPSGTHTLHFPIVVNQIQVRFGVASGTGGFVQGQLYLAGLQAHYPLRTGTNVGDDKGAVADNVELFQNYPNPLNPSTTIRYSLHDRSYVLLTVYNTLGQQVTQLVNGEMGKGFHEVKFDGLGLSSGVYFYRMRARSLDSAIGRDSRVGAGDYVQTRTLLLLK